MKNITLADISQSDFDTAVQTVISGIKSFNRKLDVRAGTVLRDLLVDPEAAIEGVMSRQIEEVRRSSSLIRIKESQDAGEDVDQDDVNSILSNFNISPSSGKKASGIIKIVVSDGSLSYSVSEGDVFHTVDGMEFVSDARVIASREEVLSPGLKRTAELYEGAAGFFFLIPATAADYGTSGNIPQGTSLTPRSPVPAFVMSEAYKDFCGGSDVQPLGSIIDSIPSGLSIRGFVNRTAVEGMLREKFDPGDSPIVAVSAVGYGDIAQRRDRHNVFGVSVGGRIDVYVRNFSDMYTKTLTLKGRRVTYADRDGEIGYEIDVPAGSFPGSCWIKSVADPFNANAGEDVLGSLAFEAKRTADISGTWHDIDPANASVEAFNTIWQGFHINLYEVPPDIDDNSSSGGEGWSEERDFKVTAYCMPNAEEVQAYVDGDDIRSVSTDVVVRCPIICNVSVNANVMYDPKNPIDEEIAKTRIRTYINGLGFVGRLTRSEIVQILKNLGAVSVEMPQQDMLYGELHDANGEYHVLSGDALDISSVEDGPSMLTKNTVVFVAEAKNIQIKMTPNS